ncbi:RES family NAD+ phosphorylase [Mesorhizobium sp. M0074]|uniref:RES family NAD+ phosphorylase n=1 Tax=Mesorhizobium sp. M0074 TaxID=2956869 RepID=UPI003335AB0C
MAIAGRKRRDSRLIDAIEAIVPVEYSGTVWRVVRQGRSLIQCSSSGGRWDDGTFDVLYTSQEREGALSEMRFHLTRGQPVIPSRVRYNLFEIDLALDRTLRLLDLAALQTLGLDTSRYGQLSYQEKHAEYPRSQDIGEAAHFLDYDGLIVPSARYDCLNVVAFCDRLPAGAMTIRTDHGEIAWASGGPAAVHPPHG